MNDTHDFSEFQCEACRAGAPTLTEAELADLLPEIPEWNVVVENGESRLRRTFEFDDFQQAFEFVRDVAEIAEEQGHHPLITLEWGRVRVDWWTHKIGGLHKNDVVMAAKTDKIYSAS